MKQQSSQKNQRQQIHPLRRSRPTVTVDIGELDRYQDLLLLHDSIDLQTALVKHATYCILMPMKFSDSSGRGYRISKNSNNMMMLMNTSRTIDTNTINEVMSTDFSLKYCCPFEVRESTLSSNSSSSSPSSECVFKPFLECYGEYVFEGCGGTSSKTLLGGAENNDHDDENTNDHQEDVVPAAVSSSSLTRSQLQYVDKYFVYCAFAV